MIKEKVEIPMMVNDPKPNWKFDLIPCVSACGANNINEMRGAIKMYDYLKKEFKSLTSKGDI